MTSQNNKFKTYNIFPTFRNKFDWFYICVSPIEAIHLDLDEARENGSWTPEPVPAKRVLPGDNRGWKMNLEINIQIPSGCFINKVSEDRWNNTGDPNDRLDLVRLFKIFLIEKELLDFKKCVFTADKKRYSKRRSASCEIKIFLENVYIFYQAPKDQNFTIKDLMIERPEILPLAWYYADLLKERDLLFYEDHLKRHLNAFSQKWLDFEGVKKTLDLKLNSISINEEEWLKKEESLGRITQHSFNISGSKLDLEE